MYVSRYEVSFLFVFSNPISVSEWDNLVDFVLKTFDQVGQSITLLRTLCGLVMTNR